MRLTYIAGPIYNFSIMIHKKKKKIFILFFATKNEGQKYL